MRITVDYKAYDAYIRSPEWSRLRRQALEKHGSVCRGCGSTEALEVHHRTYERLGREELSDLVIFCDTCHEGVHALVASGMRLGDATNRVIDSKRAERVHELADPVPHPLTCRQCFQPIKVGPAAAGFKTDNLCGRCYAKGANQPKARRSVPATTWPTGGRARHVSGRH